MTAFLPNYATGPSAGPGQPPHGPAHQQTAHYPYQHPPRFQTPRHPGEIPLLVLAALFGGVLYLSLIALLVVQLLVLHKGVNPIVILVLIAPLLILFGRGVLWATQRAQAVEITPTQFPQAYGMVVNAARHYELDKVPEAYVVAGNGSVNAFSSGHGFRRFIVLYSDLFEVGGDARDPDALAFVIGHEVGHIAAGHTSYWRMLVLQLAQYFPPLQMALSRAQEYTADNHGYSVRPQGAMGTMRLLAGGKYLNHQVDVDQYANRAANQDGFFIWFVNLLASHPIGTWRAWALRDRTKPGRIFFKPKHMLGTWVPRSPQPTAPPEGTIPSVPVGRLPDQEAPAAPPPPLGQPEKQPEASPYQYPPQPHQQGAPALPA